MKPEHDALELKKPFDGNDVLLVRHLQKAIQQVTGNVEPPLTLLSGHWSSALSTVFVLIFAGQPPTDLVLKYRGPLLQPFGHTHHLVPSRGFTRMVIHDAPCVRDAQGNLLPTETIQAELGKNIALQGITLVEGPMWTRSVLDDPTAKSRAMRFVFIDNAQNRATRICRARNYIFGQEVRIRSATNFIPHRQCARCHMLNHTTDACTCPANFKRCGLCGKQGHVAMTHNVNNCAGGYHSMIKCAGGYHSTIKCNCPPKCFNCLRAKKPTAGHFAVNDDCPLKKYMHHWMTPPDDELRPTISTNNESTTTRAVTVQPIDNL